MIRQRTIRETVSTTGVGLHCGTRVQLTLHPAPVDTGIVFRRVDVNPPVALPASANGVGDTRMASVLEKDGVRVSTVEHLMSACAGLGVDNLVVDITADEVPILDGSAASFVFLLQSAGIVLQDAPKRFLRVKKAVEVLQAKGARQAEAFPRDHRPWGWFETLALSERFQVKRIVVKPGAALSLQSHMHRSEHWIVVTGTAKVTVDGDVRLVTENESVYIPLGAKHRMENPGKLPMVLIEVQTGSYLGEDDIIRYEDVYARKQGAKG